MFVIKTAAAAGTGLLMQVGAGCLAPTIVQHDSEVVTLKYGQWESLHEIEGRAASLCATHGKDAVLRDDRAADLEPTFRYATFDCIGEGEPPLG